MTSFLLLSQQGQHDRSSGSGGIGTFGRICGVVGDAATNACGDIWPNRSTNVAAGGGVWGAGIPGAGAYRIINKYNITNIIYPNGQNTDIYTCYRTYKITLVFQI